jgi:HPt (histidine-containing phosphotransfer) domain-containing protein
VLDTTGAVIVGVRADGTLAGNASAAAVSWFGDATAGARASRYLFSEDPAGEALFRLGLSQLLDDILPWQVALDQMPWRLLRGEQILDLTYKRVPGDTELALLVVARDVTARVHSEQAEQEARERQGLVARLLLDKHGFNTFVRDAERMLADLHGEQDPQLARRILHTLKGNVAVYGLGTMARLCHRIEDRLAEAGGLPLELELRSLGKHLRDKLKGIEEFLSGLSRNVYEVETEEHEALVQSLRERRDYAELLEMVETWTWPRAAERLARLRNEGEYLARRLDKQVRIELEHNDLRLPEAYLEKFWPTLTHVVRNAIDHGIETPEQRRSAGKPLEGVLRLRTSQQGDHFRLELEDDGAGVNLPAVRDAAERRGLALKGDASDVNAIFQDGVSTRASITEVSGRGVGLSATRDACLAEGGRVEVTTRPSAGTCFTFSFYRPVVDTEAIQRQREPRWRPVNRASAVEPAGSMTLLKVVPHSGKSARDSAGSNNPRTSSARKE